MYNLLVTTGVQADVSFRKHTCVVGVSFSCLRARYWAGNHH
jgi:hypothetical protein